MGPRPGGVNRADSQRYASVLLNPPHLVQFIGLDFTIESALADTEHLGRPPPVTGALPERRLDPWQQTDVVEMGVRHDNAVQAAGIEREGTPVTGFELVVALELAAIDEQPASAELEKRAASRHGTAGSDKGRAGQLGSPRAAV